MRLLYLADRLSLAGGADHHLRQVMRAAVAAGHGVTLACGRAEAGVEPPADVTVVRVRGLASAVASRTRLAALDGLLAGADVIHAQNLMNPVALARATATGRAVVTVQDHRVFCPGMGRTLPSGEPCTVPFALRACATCLPDEGYRRATVELTRRRLDALRGARLVVLSAYMAGELAGHGLEAEVLPPWVETAPQARTDAGRGFLLGGRLVAHKGVLEGWRAWRRAATGEPLVVAGSGPLEARLEGTDRRGWLDHSELAALLGGARALIFPGRWQEPFGILAVQALALGTPVITSATGGAEAWADVGCVRCPPGDETAMATAIAALAADPGQALALGEAGRQMVAERFSRERLEPRLLALYR